MTRLFGEKNNRNHLVGLLTSSPHRRGHKGGNSGYASPHQTYRGVDMTLDFIERHRQNIFVLHIT